MASNTAVHHTEAEDPVFIEIVAGLLMGLFMAIANTDCM